MIARALGGLCLAALAGAQGPSYERTPPTGSNDIVWERDGVPGQFAFGLGSVVGDLDADGWEDVAIIVSDIELPARPRFQIWFLSGRDGTTLRVRDQFAPNHDYETVVPAGDVDGDGVPDYAFHAQEGSGFGDDIVEVASGANDAWLWSVRKPRGADFGRNLLGDVDLNGDGRPDVVASRWNPIDNLRFFAYDHIGRELYQVLRPTDLEFWRSPRMDRLGDLDGDGADEWGAGILTDTAAGAAVFSGRTGTILFRALSTSHFLGEVRASGDLDADGVSDFLLGAVIGGAVVAFSGRDGREIRSWPHQEQMGWGSLASFDADRDGVHDVIVSFPDEPVPDRPGKRGVLYAYSGRDGGQLFKIPEGGAITVGDRLSGPADGPFPLFVTGLCCPGIPDDVGRIRVYRANSRFRVREYGAPCQGGLPQQAEIGLRDLEQSGGQGVRIHLSDAPPGVCTCFVFGFSDSQWNGVPLPFDLSFLGLGGCGLYASIDLFAARVIGTTGHDRGYAFVDVPRSLFGTTGRPLYGQWLVFGPGNTWPGGLTRPLRWLAYDF